MLPFGPQTAPDMQAVRMVHRGPDGFIPLARKVGNVDWQPLGAVPVAEPLLPGILDYLETDGYFGLNTSFRRARTTERPVTGMRELWAPIPGQPGGEQLVSRPVHGVTPTGLPHALHRTDTLRWLNIAHADLDCYKVGLSIGDALGRVVNMQDAGVLPPATGFARSGRGLWVFWLLLDMQNPVVGTRDVYGVTHTPDTPQRASKRALALYAKVQHALMSRLLPLGGDLGAIDAARYGPFPGTRKSTTGELVQWWWQAGPDGGAYAYTLDTLGRAVGVELQASAHPIIRAALPHHDRNPVLSAAGRRGWRKRWQNTLGDLHILLNLRGGGFRQGLRNVGAYFYAVCLLRSGMDIPDTRAHLATYAARCVPPLDLAAQQHALQQALRPKSRDRGHVSNRRLFTLLAVTPTEAGYLEHIRPPAGDSPPRPARQTPDARREAVRALVIARGHVPPTRDMARLLDAQGWQANWTTVARDYKALGLVAVRASGGRPRRQPDLPTGPLSETVSSEA